MRKVDIVIGVMALAFGALALQQSLQFTFYNDLPGAGFLPALLAGAIMLLGALLVITRVATPDSHYAEFHPPTLAQMGRAGSVGAIVAGATFLMPIVGFVPAMLLLVAGLLLGIERKRNIGALATIVGLPFALFYLFGEALGVRLPTGPLGF